VLATTRATGSGGGAGGAWCGCDQGWGGVPGYQSGKNETDDSFSLKFLIGL